MFSIQEGLTWIILVDEIFCCFPMSISPYNKASEDLPTPECPNIVMSSTFLHYNEIFEDHWHGI